MPATPQILPMLDCSPTLLITMLDENAARKLLEPFDLQLRSSQVSQLLTYLELLMRWNAKINLTSIRTPEECVTRHFGESLYLARFTTLQGRLLDIGSGAGFPGLALRIAFPDLATTLLEPIAKKRAFLKEAARACNMGSVHARAERLDEFVPQGRSSLFDTVTVRAVGHLDTLVPQALRVLNPGGKLCLWLGENQGLSLKAITDLVKWEPPIKIPIGRAREIWIGSR